MAASNVASDYRGTPPDSLSQVGDGRTNGDQPDRAPAPPVIPAVATMTLQGKAAELPTSTMGKKRHISTSEQSSMPRLQPLKDTLESPASGPAITKPRRRSEEYPRKEKSASVPHPAPVLQAAPRRTHARNLFEAVQQGDFFTVKTFLEMNPQSLNQTNAEKKTALMLASEAGRGKIAKLLIRECFKSGEDRYLFIAAFDLALANGHAEILARFLETDPDILKHYTRLTSRLYDNALAGQGAVFHIILGHLRLLDPSDQQALLPSLMRALETAFKRAMLNNDGDWFGLLYKLDGLPAKFQKRYRARIHSLLKEEFPELVRQGRVAVLQHLNTGLMDSFRQALIGKEVYACPTLIAAARGQRFEHLQLLLQAGAIAHHVDETGWNAMMFAVKNGDVASLQELKKYGSYSGYGANEFFSLLMLATVYGRAGIVDVLLPEVDVDRGDQFGHTALMAAAMTGNLAITRKLLQAGAQIDSQEQSGDRALTIAAQFGHLEVVRLLLAQKAAVDQPNRAKWTALMFAAQNGHAAVVSELIRAGADVNYRPAPPDSYEMISNLVQRVVAVFDEGRKILFDEVPSPLMLAASRGHTGVVRLLLQKGARADGASDQGWTPLFAAIAINSRSTVRELIAGGSDVNIVSAGGMTPLMAATLANRIGIARVLCDAGAILETATPKGDTALVLAANLGHIKMCALLLEQHFLAMQPNDAAATHDQGQSEHHALQLIKINCLVHRMAGEQSQQTPQSSDENAVQPVPVNGAALIEVIRNKAQLTDNPRVQDLVVEIASYGHGAAALWKDVSFAISNENRQLVDLAMQHLENEISQAWKLVRDLHESPATPAIGPDDGPDDNPGQEVKLGQSLEKLAILHFEARMLQGTGAFESVPKLEEMIVKAAQGMIDEMAYAQIDPLFNILYNHCAMLPAASSACRVVDLLVRQTIQRQFDLAIGELVTGIRLKSRSLDIEKCLDHLSTVMSKYALVKARHEKYSGSVSDIVRKVLSEKLAGFDMEALVNGFRLCATKTGRLTQEDLLSAHSLPPYKTVLVSFSKEIHRRARLIYEQQLAGLRQELMNLDATSSLDGSLVLEALSKFCRQVGDTYILEKEIGLTTHFRKNSGLAYMLENHGKFEQISHERVLKWLKLFAAELNIGEDAVPPESLLYFQIMRAVLHVIQPVVEKTEKAANEGNPWSYRTQEVEVARQWLQQCLNLRQVTITNN